MTTATTTTRAATAQRGGSGRTRGPGDLLVRPDVVAALAVLVLNDHVLKSLWPGWVTGKLSDVAGLYFTPFLLVGLWELARRPWRGAGAVVRTERPLRLAALATGAVFAAVQVLPVAAAVYEWVLPWLRWVALAPVRLVAGSPLGDPSPLAHVADPTDLLTVPVLALVLWRGSTVLARTGHSGPLP